MKALLLWFNTTGSPPNFERYAARWIPIWFALAFICLVAGAAGGLFMVPADSKQGEIFRIIYIHVPTAWMSLFVFIVMAAQAFTPSKATITGGSIDGDKAWLDFDGVQGGEAMKGLAIVERKDGAWYVRNIETRQAK